MSFPIITRNLTLHLPLAGVQRHSPIEDKSICLLQKSFELLQFATKRTVNSQLFEAAKHLAKQNLGQQIPYTINF